MIGSTSLTLGLLLVGAMLFFITVVILREKKISVKYAIVWLIPSFMIILLALFPIVFEYIAALFGFQTISNLVIGFLLVLIIFLIMSLTIIVSNQARKITLLIQEISILKNEIENTKYSIK